MEVLFLSHSYKKIHFELVKGMTACLERNNHRVSREFDSSVTYDCILTFNRKALKHYQATCTVPEIPIIYLFCLSDIAEEYPVADTITKTIVLKDKILNIQHLSGAPLIYQDMVLPLCISRNQPESALTQPDDKPVLYVNIEDDYLGQFTFLKLLPVLNLFHHYDIYYQSRKGISRRYLNKHIRLINAKRDVEDCISRANVVIASGHAAYLAVQQGKKTIVVGEKGYGGLVTEENLEYHTGNFFQGRNGGKFDEPVPFPLLSQAIEADMPDTRKIADQLAWLQNQNQKQWIQLIETVISIAGKKTGDQTLSYILNPEYNVTRKKRRLWLSKQAFWKLHLSVNESEAVVISAFREPHAISDVLNLFPEQYKDVIQDYIGELVAEKVLIPVNF
ncbi:hypothetical protein FACS1894182_02270 [Bacteroidia bacterium]|nr:hypothetical protein FACS1894182_02270 [Bacteroidia bacterium]